MTTVCLNENREKTNVVMGEKTIALSGNGYIEDMIGQVRYRIAPESFYQVNPHITVRLYEKALEYTGLIDGTFSDSSHETQVPDVENNRGESGKHAESVDEPDTVRSCEAARNTVSAPYGVSQKKLSVLEEKQI